nr:MAG TPA: hypothetical protein [Caudoviricetes sp.]
MACTFRNSNSRAGLHSMAAVISLSIKAVFRVVMMIVDITVCCIMRCTVSV